MAQHASCNMERRPWMIAFDDVVKAVLSLSSLSHKRSEGDYETEGETDDRSDSEGYSDSDTRAYQPDNSYSMKFQWLPCEVDISGVEARITSYINNLHPREKGLYKLVEKVIDASIPLWDVTLAPFRTGKACYYPRRVEYYTGRGCAKYDPDPANAPATEGPQQLSDEDDDQYEERRQQWIYETRLLVRPEPCSFKRRPSSSFNLRERYGHRGLQVIVKFANIVLTPEKPKYQGGLWHVEGQLNEHIAATSIYCYSCENITPSLLNFRQQVCTKDINEAGHSQEDDHEWLEIIFGCDDDGPGIQDIGRVETREGRLITFPNILQHRVKSFELADPTKPGHRKILALFLVDPNIKIISTAHVPCQSKEWWQETIIQEQTIFPDSAGLAQLPMELQSIIFDEVQEFPLDIEEAKSLRLDLMKERAMYAHAQDAAFHKNHFSLSEH
ncbi:hypothetical protein CVT24_011205 [Panaeolus cyanescens]|uniref:DUF4246 domain-containing protein n=1 Tax=Panaeolus cyanescens TaxID=181874 RepID=A0A409YGE5_9AGAR|nr:hypothetical protein CVT24_011205 [Panaeolus cyanescens]